MVHLRKLKPKFYTHLEYGGRIILHKMFFKWISLKNVKQNISNGLFQRFTFFKKINFGEYTTERV